MRTASMRFGIKKLMAERAALVQQTFDILTEWKAAQDRGEDTNAETDAKLTPLTEQARKLTAIIEGRREGMKPKNMRARWAKHAAEPYEPDIILP